MNVLKRSDEGDRVAVWAESDQATDVCEVALAVVSAQSDQLQLLCEVVLVVLGRSKVQEPP